jgi:hypothetical protein
MAAGMTGSQVETAALDWLRELGYAVLYGPAIAAGDPAAERSDPNYRGMVEGKGVDGPPPPTKTISGEDQFHRLGAR